MNKLKAKITNFLLETFIKFFDKNTKKKLILLAYFFKLIAKYGQSKYRAKRMLWLFKTDHVYLEWWIRVFKNLNFETKKKFIGYFFINVMNGKYMNKRLDFKRKNSFAPPPALIISMTKNCNYNCMGCWAKQYSDFEEMPYQKWKDILLEAKNDMGIVFYYVVGGEPFLRKDFLKLAEEFSDCLFFTYTNASLLSDELIEKIKKLGNIYPMISINGFKETNDKIRGEGSYDLAYEKFDKLKQAGIFWGISCTATKDSYKEVSSYEFQKMLSDKGAFWCWVFNLVPSGNIEDFKYMLSAQQKLELYKNIIQIRNTLPILTVDAFKDALELGGCAAAGHRTLHINPRGDVEPCPLLHVATHNINECSLKEALESDFLSEFRKNIPYKDANTLRPCLVLDRPELLKEYMEKYSLKETQYNSLAFIKNEEQRKLLFEYAKESKELFDKEWENKKYMGLYPMDKQWFYDSEHLCGYKKPLNGKHGGGYPEN